MWVRAREICRRSRLVLRVVDGRRPRRGIDNAVSQCVVDPSIPSLVCNPRRSEAEPDRVSRGPRNQDAVLGGGDPPLSCRTPFRARFPLRELLMKFANYPRPARPTHRRQHAPFDGLPLRVETVAVIGELDPGRADPRPGSVPGLRRDGSCLGFMPCRRLLGIEMREPLEPPGEVPVRSPSSFMVAGRSTARTRMASIRIAAASPRGM